ncbi:hypothetical protein [Thalassolituus sp. C2-1]|uniref:hypothetical protein n=1 Tax=Venatorbacter sp. C2-1 TaxID=2597518 RepID=UPI00119739E0|nr:hypothetical protein [Thalassolituus sp. C2-1]TVV44096.1 hypothetical protein FOT50_10710 [Thalassolituus sp. C2-1]
MEIYTSIYDITEHGFSGWRFAVPGVLFLVVGLALWKMPIIHAQNLKLIGKTCFFFSFSWCVAAFGLSYRIHIDAIEAYRLHSYQVYSGVIESHKGRLGEATVEVFKIGNKRLWDDNLPVGQRTIQPELPSLKNEVGSNLRIYMAKGLVLKIEKVTSPQ